jgi:hypothetical protein
MVVARADTPAAAPSPLGEDDDDDGVVVKLLTTAVVVAALSVGLLAATVTASTAGRSDVWLLGGVSGRG